ncbi:MAG: hypothetical protein KJ884_13880 [Gammaproteobacteria bacterium]|nr:hypothetical protein [Gammaproteobacteria bacterium]MBU2140416.1 hypothetical protein [Gammaproteobacteria bacterium]MBU2324039.1 hypothetical protein [Gammaproteobacteria bacterium]
MAPVESAVTLPASQALGQLAEIIGAIAVFRLTHQSVTALYLDEAGG